MQIPAELAWVADLVGFVPSQDDPARMVEAGKRWIAYGTALQGSADEANGRARAIWTDNRGSDAAAFAALWNADDGPLRNMRDDATMALLVGLALVIAAVIVAVLLIGIIVQLAILADQIVQALVTAGGMPVELPVVIGASRDTIGQLVERAMSDLKATAAKLLREDIPKLLRDTERSPASKAANRDFSDTFAQSRRRDEDPLRRSVPKSPPPAKSPPFPAGQPKPPPRPRKIWPQEK